MFFSSTPNPPGPHPYKKFQSLVFYLKLGTVLLLLLGLLSFLSVRGRAKERTSPQDLPLKITFIPEAERPLDLCVMGLDANQSSYFLLPQVEKTKSLDEAQVREIQQQSYWLNFEMSHGRILQALPPATEIYVAVPDSSATTLSLGGEEDLLKGYLKAHCGWDSGQIQRRIHFFKSPMPMVWTQDIGKILGRDQRGRWVIDQCAEDPEPYRKTVSSLCEAYPDKFVPLELPDGVSAEGGDEDLVRTPDGQLLLLAGRHRAVRYLQWKKGSSWLEIGGKPSFDDPLKEAQVHAAEEAFRKAFHPLKVHFLPSRVLRDPALGNNELFHLDMAAAVAGTPGHETAFVPTYLPKSVDRLTGQPLDRAFVRGLQGELDSVARELRSLGFPVTRIPLGDHPVRSPANFVRYYNPVLQRCAVLLSKYPRHLNGPFRDSSQGELLARLEHLRGEVQAWEDTPDLNHFQSVLHSFQQGWEQMDRIASEENPIFNEIKASLQKAGLEVVTVPDFPWGAGGLHCELLH